MITNKTAVKHPAGLELALSRLSPRMNHTKVLSVYVLILDSLTGYYVCIFGDGENLSFEWLLFSEINGIAAHSNQGFGSIVSALKSGLTSV